MATHDSSAAPVKSGSADETQVVEILYDAVANGVRLLNVQRASGQRIWVVERTVRNAPLLEKYWASRENTTADLSRFSLMLSEVQEHRVTATNTVDSVGYPENFTYITENIYSDEVPRPCTPMFSCECTNGCVSACPCVQDTCYDSNGRVRVPLSVPLMECGPKCRCGSGCKTRVVQRGTRISFEIRRFAQKGWGALTKQRIPRGTFIAEYVGEVISFEEAERRGLEDTAVGLTYLFDLDMACGSTEAADFSVDAKTHGNVSHFFNHSCQPNMEIRPVYVEHRDPRLHHLAFFSSRDIAAGEELTFDYSPYYSLNAGASAASGDTVHNAKFACHCGTKECRGFIYF
ncbi:hypothetical protein IW140_003606 [Coemansia sp. RSA 1813]|nr:hypothetical protein EV178_003559 [Coemansia sp. RSA 1646]KAJ1772856.1 hypothetical protein LPJ74_001195 [Coemansia sp. RSA 1843]KAJ2088880.1 hypothetical protein IW138_003841 [Coemansia sp. RSA 986]KAJ2213969.1 hypothetical protein EV179_003439 [Coemansia sp. RSA 487]KAJ2568723.1 hypothetical protein IW140_003606 [Coemansia sp. RSA 1813]